MHIDVLPIIPAGIPARRRTRENPGSRPHTENGGGLARAKVRRRRRRRRFSRTEETRRRKNRDCSGGRSGITNDLLPDRKTLSRDRAGIYPASSSSSVFAFVSLLTKRLDSDQIYFSKFTSRGNICVSRCKRIVRVTFVTGRKMIAGTFERGFAQLKFHPEDLYYANNALYMYIYIFECIPSSFSFSRARRNTDDALPYFC